MLTSEAQTPLWSEEERAYVQAYVKNLTPWLGGPEAAARLVDALWLAGVGGVDLPIFHGRSREAAHRRSIFAHVWDSRDLSAAHEPQLFGWRHG